MIRIWSKQLIAALLMGPMLALVSGPVRAVPAGDSAPARLSAENGAAAVKRG